MQATSGVIAAILYTTLGWRAGLCCADRSAEAVSPAGRLHNAVRAIMAQPGRALHPGRGLLTGAQQNDV